MNINKLLLYFGESNKIKFDEINIIELVSFQFIYLKSMLCY